MKRTISLQLAAMAIIMLLFLGCSSHEKKEEIIIEEVVVPSTIVPDAEAGIDPSQVDFSFVFMGCNRVAEYSEAKNGSTANVFQLQRTFNEVSAMKIKSKFFFFLGDLVLGLNVAGDTLHDQLKAWVEQFKSPAFSNMPKSGIRLIAVPGNHEMLYEPGPDSVKVITKRLGQPLMPELPWKTATPIWRSLMQPYSIQPGDKYGLSISSADSITYSFNYNGTHFVLMNTDTYYSQQPFTPGLAPAAWICNDITTAKKTGNIRHIFVMGHKPAYILLNETRAYQASHDDIMDTNVTSQVWPVMEANQAEAMLSAHRHEFSVLQPDPLKTYQIIAGNGGSKYESHLPVNNQFFGFTKIYVMKNGQVITRSFGRIVPKHVYYKPMHADTLTRIRYNDTISWGTRAAWFDPTDSIQLAPGKKQ